MRLWQTDYDFAVGAHRHTLAKGFGHSLMASLQCDAFRVLEVSAAVWNRGTDWFPIHSTPTSVGQFELWHGVEADRGSYNRRNLLRAWRLRQLVRGEHAGYSDLFVPLVKHGRTAGILAVGSFARTLPTAQDVRERWHWISKRPADTADPEFAAYLSATLSLLVLEAPQAERFERMVTCIAALMAGVGKADALANEAGALSAELAQVRLPERMWSAVRSMVDERSARAWESAYSAHELSSYGLSRLAEHVLVGLTSNPRSSDAVDDALRQNAFQRAVVELARHEGDSIVGQVGGRGVVLLCATKTSPQRSQRRLLDLSQRVAALGRRHFGLESHFGASAAVGSVPLGKSYRAALAAAESALGQGASFVGATEREQRTSTSLWQLRQTLSRVTQERVELLPVRFERYLDAVERHCGDRVQPTRAHLEIGFERVAEALVADGALDEKSLDDVRATLSRDADTAGTSAELCAEFRRAVAEMSEGLSRPVPARQARSLRRAESYIRQHFAGPLRLESVAKIAGFSASYFSKLLAQRERASFARYVLGLRVERAKQLLRTTDADAARVARMCGFRTPQYFNTAFKRATGTTPGQWRRRAPDRRRSPRKVPKA